MRFNNPTSESIAVRDDAGKHHVEPGDSIEITGEQHAPVWAEAGLVAVVEAVEEAEPVATKGGRRPAKDPDASSSGEAGGHPDQAAG